MTPKAHFLGKLKTLLDRCEISYEAYMNSGKKFLYAKILKDCNESIRHLLIKNTHILPAEQTKNAISLIHHIDIWSTIWEDTEHAKRPTLTSYFAFENTASFPHEEVALLMSYYEKIRNHS